MKLVSAGLFLLLSMPATAGHAAPHKRHASPPRRDTPTAVTEMTRLRAKQPVVIYVSRAGTTRIEHLNVEVANMGAAAAFGIEVTAEWGSGLAFSAKGARSLGPGRRALYTIGSRRVVIGSGPPRIVVRCANCKR